MTSICQGFKDKPEKTVLSYMKVHVVLVYVYLV